MKNPLLILAAVFTVLVLPGCLQSETTIYLNKDGSGMLVEENKLGAEMLDALSQLSAGVGGDVKTPKEDPLKQIFSADKGKKRAAELGEGVTFEKFELLETQTFKGARVTYQFKDINKLQQVSISSMPNALGVSAANPSVLHFIYTDGNLTIKMPQPRPFAKKSANENKPPQTPEAEEKMKKALAGLKISAKLVVAPGIAQTNASYHDGNTITLEETDFDKLMQKPENIKKFGQVDQRDPAAAMAALKGIDGVKTELQNEVTVTVK